MHACADGHREFAIIRKNQFVGGIWQWAYVSPESSAFLIHSYGSGAVDYPRCAENFGADVFGSHDFGGLKHVSCGPDGTASGWVEELIMFAHCRNCDGRIPGPWDFGS